MTIKRLISLSQKLILKLNKKNLIFICLSIIVCLIYISVISIPKYKIIILKESEYAEKEKVKIVKLLHQPGFKTSSTHLCPNQGKHLKIFVGIISEPKHKLLRSAIRKTWGQYTKRNDISIGFFIGHTEDELSKEYCKMEKYLYNDLIEGKFEDTYDNLTLKSLSIFEWISTICPNVTYLLKTDDDVFINMKNLLEFTSNLNSQSRRIYGKVEKESEPYRNPKIKYFISWQQYKYKKFPDFTTGPAYLMPSQIATDLYKTALNYTYVKLEDVFFTGILTKILRIKLVHVPSFYNEMIMLNQKSLNKAISVHNVRRHDFFNIWKIINNST